MPKSKKQSPDKRRTLNAEIKRVSRKDADLREREREANSQSRRNARENPFYREVEQAANSDAKRKSRERDEFRTPEKLMDNARKRKLREDPQLGPSVRVGDMLAKRVRRSSINDNYEILLESFHELIQHSPSVTCSCCGCMWYDGSTVATSRENLISQGISEEGVAQILSVNLDNPRLCKTCKKHVSGRGGKLRIPKLALSNGFNFPVIPNELKGLSPLEERLVAGRIPFMQIRLRGPGQQSTITGSLVNVENDVVLCTKSIPRSINETGMVQVKLMRRMHYQHPYMDERIRPFVVHRAAAYLVSTPLYAHEGILICNKWEGRDEGDTEDFVVEHPTDGFNASMENNTSDVDNEASAADNIVNEDFVHANDQVYSETFLFCDDEVEFGGIKIAPGEGNIPIPLFRDEFVKDLSFPTINCGQIREYRVKVSFTDIAKSELRRYDRRACHPTHIFWVFKKLLTERITNAAQVAIRQRSGATITAEKARCTEYLRNLLERDDGYAIFRHIRASPCYWKDQQKKVLAMIRQLGIPTFFITVSAAETHWPELLRMLHKIVKGAEISEEGASNLPFLEKAELIGKDPVTCMLNYDHRFRALLSKLLKPPGGIFSPFEMTDFFTRLEFQLRGSPHTHGIYWLKNAPIYKEGCPDSERNCIEFIDQFITCERDEVGEMEKLLSYQLHNHTQTCYKRHRTKKNCRFGFPKPPLPRTMILSPFDRREEDKSDIDKKRGTFRQVQDRLTELGRSFKGDLSFAEFLTSVNLTLEEYILAIRSSIRSPTVFLKRKPSEAFINGYNKKLLTAWKANIDFQYILDPYACAKYCVGYIMKADSGVSKLLQAVSQEVKAGNLTVKDQLKKFAKVLNHGSEVSAQEAVAFILGLHNTDSSRQDIFINTGEPARRIGMLKPQHELESLEDDSNDIFLKGLIDHYTKRPPELKHECLANFAAMYEFEGNKESDDDSDLMEGMTDNDCNPNTNKRRKQHPFTLQDKSGHMRPRGKSKVIRFCNFKKDIDPKNYCRERLMLFKPWENEEEELINADVVAEYEKEEARILINSKPYFYYSEEEHVRLTTYFAEIVEDEEDQQDQICEISNFEDIEIDEVAMCGEFEQRRSRSKVENFRPPKLVDDLEYSNLMRSLNDKQRRFTLNVMHQLKTSNEPFFYFLSGGAGVGKSHVVHAIVQSCLRFYLQQPSIHPEQSPVIVCAPTGKAAFNVMGMTLHCVFKLPPNQSTQFSKLNPDTLNTVRMLLRNVKLFIIDEISMTSDKQLWQINERLQQIFGNKEHFGGKSVIVVGHLRQLPPVMADFPFVVTTTEEESENSLWRQFQLFELEEIMRQWGQHDFCEALNNMAEGRMTKKDIELIRSREISDTNRPPANAFRLFRSNEQCVAFNENFHSSLSSDGAWATAFDRVIGRNVSQETTEYYDGVAKTLRASDAEGLPYRTHLQVGATYFVSANIDVSDGLFNGSTGTLRQIDYGSNSCGELIPSSVWIEFHHPLVGAISRSRTRNTQVQQNINLKWTSVKRMKRSMNLGPKFLGIELIREQIPIVAADALTINKAQGSSLPYVVVSVKPHKGKSLSRALLYVACSRATSLDGLFIDGSFVAPKPPRKNDQVTSEMERLRKISFVFNLTFLQDFPTDSTTLFFMNIEYIRKHQLDIAADLCPMAATFLAFVEPHILPEDNISFNGFQLAHRSNSATRQNSDGSILFISDRLPNVQVNEYSRRDNTGHCLVNCWKYKNVNFIMSYKSPKCKQNTYFSLLKEVLNRRKGKTVFFGDINIDISKSTSFLQFMQQYNLESKLEASMSSTIAGTHIDCLFSNIPNLSGSFYETYFGHHKAICVILPTI